MLTLNFYTTLGCHLCEEAETILAQFIESAMVTVNSIDIIEAEEGESERLLSLYGLRIPVLKRQDNAEELSWPFDEFELAEFIQS